MKTISIMTIVLGWLCATVIGADSQPITYGFGVEGNVVEFNDAHALFELHTSYKRKDDMDKVLVPGDFGHFERRKNDKTETLVWSDPPKPWPKDLRVVVTMKRLESEVETQLAIESPGGVEIRKVKFPAIDVVPTYHFDTLLMSHPMGDAMYYPKRVIGARMGGECVYRYPATLGMQYMVLFNGGRSYYLSAYSTGDETFEHSAKTLRDGMRLSCVWYPFLDKGKWQSPACGFAVLTGGWHSSADLYRSRMGKIYRPPELPKWMRESFHGWMQVSFKGAEKNPPFKFTDIPKLYETVTELGLNVLHIFSWGEGGFDSDYPLRFPSSNNGTAEQLRAAMDEVKSRGGHVVLYTNGRLIDPDTTFFSEQGGDKAYAVDEAGKPYEETYNHKFYVGCPAAKPFADALFDNFERMLTIYGNNAAQIDQIGCTPGVFCFHCEAHGHRTPATNFLKQTDAFLKRIHDYYRSKDPDFFVWAEGTNERFGQFYEVHQHHGEEGWWTPGDSLPEQFRYTYPDYLLTGISNDIPMMCHTHGQGKPFDFNLRRVYNEEAEPAYFLRGLFRDTVGVRASGQDLRWWRIDRRDTPGTLVNLHARGRGLNDRAEASVRLPQNDWPVRAVYPDDLSITKDGHWLELTWTGPIATIAAEPKQK